MLDNLDVYGNLESTSSSDSSRRVGTDRDWHVDVVRADNTAHDRVGATLGCITDSEPALQLLSHRVEKVTLDLGRRCLIVEGQHGHRPDIRRQTTAGKPVTDAATGEKQAEKNARTGPKSKHQKAEPLVRA